MLFYKKNKFSVFQRNLASISLAVLVLFFAGSIIFGKALREAFLEPDYVAVILFLSVTIFITGIGLYGAISMLLENLRSAFWVEMYDEKMIGYSFNQKKIWELRFDHIFEMFAPNGVKPISILQSMVFIDKSGKMYLISINVEKFGTLMESIKERAVNARKIKLGSWPSNWLVWKK